jgi:hypothetical protein
MTIETGDSGKGDPLKPVLLAERKIIRRSARKPAPWWVITSLKWLIVLCLAVSLAGVSLQHAMGPIAEGPYSPEFRVLDGATNTMQTIAIEAVVIVEQVSVIIDSTLRSLAMRVHIHNFMSTLVAGLALAMVLAEFLRGAREMRRHLQESSAERRHWKRWATGLGIALPCLIAMLYYSVHGTMA